MSEPGMNQTSLDDLSQCKVLLVGREGNGKTSCVRTISPHVNAPTVSQCKGVCDTGEDLRDNINDVIQRAGKLIKELHQQGGVDAIGFVLKYGVRFTKQEKNAVESARSILGNDVFQKYGFVLFTYGDLFELDVEDEPLDFEQWCRQQTGDIQKLFEEVNYRIVLLDNKTKDLTKRTQQFTEFKQTIRKVQRDNQNKKYTMHDFENAQPGQTIIYDLKKNRQNGDMNWLAFLIFLIKFYVSFIFDKIFFVIRNSITIFRSILAFPITFCTQFSVCSTFVGAIVGNVLQLYHSINNKMKSSAVSFNIQQNEVISCIVQYTTK
ncbi:hypothetical protein Btru_048130 [Bulinus truncatus]|nr:hypothetical protein Btru_048130 [Bulinus truncatus]